MSNNQSENQSKKPYVTMQLSTLGSLTELTQLGLGKSGAMTDGSNDVGNMMN
jgi:hypothetical protein